MSGLDDLLGSGWGDLFGGLDTESYERGQRRIARLAAGIPKDAEGPWDEALAIARQARSVSRSYRALTDPPA